MAENKFVVKTVFHDENGDTLLREDYLLLLTEVVTMGAVFHYRSFLIYAWDVLFWLS